MYLCLLVELSWFRVVFVGFLVVGHTHALIDQTFSAIKRRISKAKFIASPAAMMKLLEATSAPELVTGRSGRTTVSKYRMPAAQYRVAIVHDYKTLLEPYFDKAVSMYNVPYNFKIENLGGIACVQAQMYVGAAWFPARPPQFLKVRTVCVICVLCVCYACVMCVLCVCYVCYVCVCYVCVPCVLCVCYMCVMCVLCVCYVCVMCVMYVCVMYVWSVYVWSMYVGEVDAFHRFFFTML
jgi:hypothetical protein